MQDALYSSDVVIDEISNQWNQSMRSNTCTIVSCGVLLVLSRIVRIRINVSRMSYGLIKQHGIGQFD